MSVTVRIPAPLREQTGGRAAVELEATSVREALDALCARHPSLRRHLFSDDGRVRGYVNIYVNEADSRERGGTTAPIAPGDVVTIVPSIAGG